MGGLGGAEGLSLPHGAADPGEGGVFDWNCIMVDWGMWVALGPEHGGACLRGEASRNRVWGREGERWGALFKLSFLGPHGPSEDDAPKGCAFSHGEYRERRNWQIGLDLRSL